MLTVSSKSIIEIIVPEASYHQKPVFLNNDRDNCFIRTGDGDRRPTSEQFRYMVSNSNEYVDTTLLNNFSIEDLNRDDIDRYRMLMIKNTNRTDLASLSHADFLYEIGCIQIDRRSSERTRKLTTGALLFFGNYNSIISRYPAFQLDYFKKKSSYDPKWIRRISTGDMNYPNLNIYSFYELVLQVLTTDIVDGFTQDSDLTRGSYYSDMTLAVKEALVNTLMHAYYDSSQPIKIYDFPDYYEFFNPGDMRVSKEEFIHGSHHISRNSIISLLLRRVGIAERAGSGGPTIFSAAVKNQLRVPNIVREPDSTMLRIWKVDLFSSMKGLNEYQKIVVSFAMAHNNVFTINELLVDTELTEYKARTTVKQLLELGTLKRAGKGRSTEYYLDSTEEASILGYKLMLKRFEDHLNRN